MSKSPTTKTATTGRNRPEARTWTAAQNWTITAIANVLNKTEWELKEVFSGTDFATLMAEVEDWKATAGKPTVPSISRITSQNSAQPTSDQVGCLIFALTIPSDNPFSDNPFSDNPFSDNPFFDIDLVLVIL